MSSNNGAYNTWFFYWLNSGMYPEIWTIANSPTINRKSKAEQKLKPNPSPGLSHYSPR